MRILLVDCPVILREHLVQALARRHEVLPFSGDVRNLDDCRAAADCDVVIHGLDASAEDVERLDSATRGTWNLLTTTRATRYILLCSMCIFDQYDAGWHVDEAWSPRPTTAVDDLAPYLAEVASREISRVRPVECLVLRLDEVVHAKRFAAGAVQPRWLHVADAVSAIVKAVELEQRGIEDDRWSTFNIVRGGSGSRFPAGMNATSTLGFVASHRDTQHSETASETPGFPASPAALDDLPVPERILILGAGGPIGAAATTMLKDDHQLRLAGRRSMAEVAAAPPQSEGAPLPSPATPPHEEMSVDVTDPNAVLEAASDMDAIINLTVLRPDPVEAFRVNTLGAWHVMRAAVHHGIRRVVHTGPILTLGQHPSGYTQDRDVPSNVPSRPGDNLYFISKFLGQEICRIFAEQHHIACPTLLYCGFIDPKTAECQQRLPHPFTISWEDSGRSLAAAVRVPHVPEPFVVIHILADSPHDRYCNDTARQLLDWELRDRLDHLWYRRDADLG